MQSSQQNSNNIQEISNNKPVPLKGTPSQIASNQNSLQNLSFSPILTNTLISSDYGRVFYNQRHNLIINISMNTMVAFNASTLEEIKTHKLDDWVVDASYYEEIDTYIVGCESGSIYIYNASKDELKELKKCESYVLGVEFLGSRFYAFLLSESQGIFIGNLEDENVVCFASENIQSNGFHYLVKSKLLLSSFDNGSVKIFNTDKLPYLREIFSVQADQKNVIGALQSFWIKGKEYVITSGLDFTLKIWHFIKGKMRLLKVIPLEHKIADSVVYLERYNMVAVSYERDHIDFFKLPSWKLEETFCFDKSSKRRGLFLMKDKNMIGCDGPYGCECKKIDFIRLNRKKYEWRLR